MKQYLRTGICLTALLATTALAAARPPEGTPAQRAADRQEAAVPDSAYSEAARRARFSDSERTVLRDYLARNRDDYWQRLPAQQQGLPPGLQKKVARGGRLPPGWQKKLNRGEVLSDDLRPYALPLPEDVIGRLPRRVPGTELRQIDDRVLRVDETTQAILDILYLTGN